MRHDIIDIWHFNNNLNQNLHNNANTANIPKFWTPEENVATILKVYSAVKLSMNMFSYLKAVYNNAEEYSAVLKLSMHQYIQFLLNKFTNCLWQNPSPLQMHEMHPRSFDCRPCTIFLLMDHIYHWGLVKSEAFAFCSFGKHIAVEVPSWIDVWRFSLLISLVFCFVTSSTKRYPASCISFLFFIFSLLFINLIRTGLCMSLFPGIWWKATEFHQTLQTHWYPQDEHLN